MFSHINSRLEGEIYRSLSRERRPGYGTVRARSGSRERTEDRVQRSEERGRSDSSRPRSRIPRPSPSPTGTAITTQGSYIIHLKKRLVAQRLSVLFEIDERTKNKSMLHYSHFVLSQGHGGLVLTPLLTSRTNSADKKKQISRSRISLAWF